MSASIIRCMWMAPVRGDYPLSRHFLSRLLLTCIGFAVMACSAWAQGLDNEPRHALVVGNSDYSNAPLRNPVNDADDMAAVLESLGFRVTKLKNASKIGRAHV